VGEQEGRDRFAADTSPSDFHERSFDVSINLDRGYFVMSRDRAGYEHATAKAELALGSDKISNTFWSVQTDWGSQPAGAAPKCREVISAVSDHRDTFGLQVLQRFRQIEHRLRPGAYHRDRRVGQLFQIG
jgi:hypothetical protein